MAAEWYYQRGGEVYGPFEPEQLRGRAAAGEVRPETLIRRGESGEWVPANRVKGLLAIEPAVPLTKPSDQPPMVAADQQPEVRMACWYCGAYRPASVPFCGACGASWQSARPAQVIVQQQAAASGIDGRAVAGLLFLTIAGIVILFKAVGERSAMLSLGGLALAVTALLALVTSATRRRQPAQGDQVTDHVRRGFGYLGYVAMQAAVVMVIASAVMGAIALSAIIALISICTGAMQ